MRYRTIFALGTGLDGVEVDMLYTVDMEKLAVAQAKRRLTDDRDMYEVEVDSVFRKIEMRSRFARGGGPYNLHSDVPLSRDELGVLLRQKRDDGTLREFLDEARM